MGHPPASYFVDVAVGLNSLCLAFLFTYSTKTGSADLIRIEFLLLFFACLTAIFLPLQVLYFFFEKRIARAAISSLIWGLTSLEVLIVGFYTLVFRIT
jgi:hypothetical protein